jgi:hypothetical protein
MKNRINPNNKTRIRMKIIILFIFIYNKWQVDQK